MLPEEALMRPSSPEAPWRLQDTGTSATRTSSPCFSAPQEDVTFPKPVNMTPSTKGEPPPREADLQDRFSCPGICGFS